MTAVTEEQVLDALGSVHDPDTKTDIVTQGMVNGLQVKDGHVAFAIEVAPERGPNLEPLRAQAEKTIHGLPGVITVTVVLTAERPQAQQTPKQAEPHNHDAHDAQHHGAGRTEEAMMPGVRSIIAVASGKGGVGKSTTSANLALSLAAKGLAVGLLDADIYGPSMPRMLGISGQPVSHDGKRLEPMENHGIKVMSIGFLVEEDSPMIWRGPMVMGALEQMMRDVNWGDLDVLVVDMPPGTGDAQLTMAQRVPLTGAIIVSTPQDIALLDARKGLNMFRKVDVPVLGVIENMSYFNCPHCGERTDVFSHGGARKVAAKMGADFLGEIPLDIAIRETSDAGTPIVVTDPENGHSKAYQAVADKVWDKVQTLVDDSDQAGPKIVMD